MSIRLTNFVFRVSLPLVKQLCLWDVAERAHKFYGSARITLRAPSPTMLVIRQHKKQTLIIFPNGKLRLMGARIRTKKAAKRAFRRVTQKLLPSSQQQQLPKVYIQTITATHDVGRPIHLQKLHVAIQEKFSYGASYDMPGYMNLYEAELFPALQLRIWGMAMHVNIFATGKCVITGLKHFDEACVVADDINNYVSTCT